ncbi:hypothetical protein cypCar_00034691 [Cyprinus carpio]|nr:hypothetical protein cypCar_00034691 [Cyprinus carpio]
MEDDIQEEVLSQFKERRLGGWQVLQLTAGTGLAVYAVWAGILMPGFRRVPLRLQVDLSAFKNVTVFLAPSVLSLLQKKLLAELPEDAVIVAGRFPFPDWTACKVEGEGVDRAWAYHVQELRHRYKSQDRHEETS